MTAAAIDSCRSLSLSRKLLWFCLGYSLLALCLFPQTFLALAGQYPILRFFFMIPVLISVGLLVAGIVHAPRAPVSWIRQKLADRGIGAAIIILVLIVSATAFTTYKHEYSKLVPFFADPVLAEIDRTLHFGDPWTWLRAIVHPGLDYTFFLLYSALWFIEVLTGILVAAFLADRHARARYFASFTVSVILLSSVIRVAGSSSGPILYDRVTGGSRFAELIAELEASPAGPQVLELTNYLYTSYATDTMVLGTGISAMPSLHVAIAFLNALFFASINRVAGVIAWAYAAFIMFGSVYFGWHYAIDGYVSIAVVLLFWKLFSARTQAA